MKIFAVTAVILGSFLISAQAQSDNTDSCPVPCMDGVFLLDVSNSIKRGEFNEMINFVLDIFRLVNISAECSHAAVMLFKANVVIRFDLNQYTDRDDLINAVQNINHKSVKGRGTNTPEALRVLRLASQNGTLGLRLNDRHIPKIAVMITGGNPTLNKDFPQYNITKTSKAEMQARLKDEAGKLHGLHIYDQIYAIGVGSDVHEDTLKEIADPMDLNFLLASFTPEAFQQLRDNITAEFCDPCLLQPCPPGTNCTECEATGERFCVQSCTINNGGCAEGHQCTEVPNPDCQPGQCCSHVNVTCSSVVVKFSTDSYRARVNATNVAVHVMVCGSFDNPFLVEMIPDADEETPETEPFFNPMPREILFPRYINSALISVPLFPEAVGDTDLDFMVRLVVPESAVLQGVGLGEPSVATVTVPATRP